MNTEQGIHTLHHARQEIVATNFTFIPGDSITIDADLKTDQQQFYAEWDSLEADNYLRDGAHFRLRRMSYCYFHPASDALLPLAEAAYFQPREMNSYAGGIEREFAPMSDAGLANRFFQALVRFNFRYMPVDEDMLADAWLLDVHQIRTIAHPQEVGEPTPEGVHQDGNDYIAMHLIHRDNVAGGLSSITDMERQPISSLTLGAPMDTMLVCDPEVMHGVTPIQSANGSQPAIRDMLLIGYDHKPALQPPNGQQT